MVLCIYSGGVSLLAEYTIIGFADGIVLSWRAGSVPALL